MTRASFGRNVTKKEFKNALMYRLQRKSHNANDQNVANNTENTLTNFQLLIVWTAYNDYSIHVNAVLVKYDDTIIWDEDKLRKLCAIRHPLYNYYEVTWRLDNTTLLMTTPMWSGYGRAFEIRISEATSRYNAMEPISISSI
jgi:hypothetical protein